MAPMIGLWLAIKLCGIIVGSLLALTWPGLVVSVIGVYLDKTDDVISATAILAIAFWLVCVLGYYVEENDF